MAGSKPSSTASLPSTPSIATHPAWPVERYSTVNVPLICASHSQITRADVEARPFASTARFAGGATRMRFHNAAALLTVLFSPPSLAELTTQRTCVPRSSEPTVSSRCEPFAPGTSAHASLPRGAVCHTYESFSDASPSTFVETSNEAFRPSSATTTSGVTFASESALPAFVVNPGPSTVADCRPGASTWVTRHS